MELNIINLRKAVKELNTVFDKKIRYIGVKKDIIIENFGNAVEKAHAEKIKLPEFVVEYYNLLFTECIDEELTQKKEIEIIKEIIIAKDIVKEKVVKKTNTRKKKGEYRRKSYSVRHPKMNGVVAESCKLLKANPNITNAEILDELEILFPEKLRNSMYSTVGHATCIGRIMLVLFGIKVGQD